jgi:O-antigen/teichoic acid export membrane protein
LYHNNKSELSGIKKLAGQTMWYGVSSIAARFINYLLTPYLTYQHNIHTNDYGQLGLVYAAIPILNIIFTYGFETAYFRFSSKKEHDKAIYSTASLSILFSTIFFTILLWISQSYFGDVIGLQNFPAIIQLTIAVIALDALSTVPFARLRHEGRPRKFAFIKIAGVLINIFFTWFFISYCPQQVQENSSAWVTSFFNPTQSPVYYIVLANLIQSAFTLFLLGREILEIRFSFDVKLWKQMMIYSLPLVLAGMGGMINETFDRLMLRWWLPGSENFKDSQVGIYNACYKLSILITLFIQAFRMGAEPFFFKQAEGKNPQFVYARVMKFFVITICVMFLVVSLFLPVWQLFIGAKYRAGLVVVPILLFANMFLGIYYNLGIWYKLGNKTKAGAYITIIGAVITFVINYLFIPSYNYVACAWATFACYGAMMLISFLWGQKEYRIPYAWKKLLAYMIMVAALYFIHIAADKFIGNRYYQLGISTLLTLGFIAIVAFIERKEFQNLGFFKTARSSAS